MSNHGTGWDHSCLTWTASAWPSFQPTAGFWHKWQS